MAFAGGTGIPSDPYLIETFAQLQEALGFPTASFRLIADIDASPTAYPDYQNGYGWETFSTWGDGTPDAVFDGNGHIIRNLYLNRQTTDFQSFFGQTDSGVVKDLGIVDILVHDSYRFGAGMVGYILNATVFQRCFVTGQIGSYAGNGTGLRSGGFAARDYDGGAVFEDCYFQGTLIGDGSNYAFGGFLATSGGSGSIFRRCYSAAEIDGQGSTTVAAFVQEGTIAEITECYYDADLADPVTDAYAIGKNTADMQNRTTFESTYDFTNIWTIYEADYPRLQLFYPIPESTTNLSLQLDEQYGPPPSDDVHLKLGPHTDLGVSGPYENQDFTLSPATYPVEGTITRADGKPLANIQVTAGVFSTTTDESGHYTLHAESGTYDVTPSHLNGTFTPTAQSVTVNEAVGGIAGIDFQGELAIYTIEGYIRTDESDGVANIQLELTGDTNHSVVTDESGHYTFSNLTPGQYTLTPALSNTQSTEPSDVTLTIDTSDIRQDFTLRYHYMVNGVIEDRSGDPAIGIQVNANPTSGQYGEIVYTDISGQFALDLDTGEYVITPEKVDWSFEPSTVSVTVSGDYTIPTILGSYHNWEISGQILDGLGDPLTGVTVSLTGALSDVVTTDGNGNYLFRHIATGSYTITPTKDGYYFDPTEQTVDVNNASVGGIDFLADTGSYLIYGTIHDDLGNPLEGVVVDLTGDQVSQVTTQSTGYFEFEVPAGNYEITASKTEYTFDPGTLILSVGADTGDSEVFIDATLNTYTLSGNVVDELGYPVKNIQINLTGTCPERPNVTPDVTLTDLTGEWAFELPVGTYTVSVDPEEIEPSDGSFPDYEWTGSTSLTHEITGPGSESTDNIFPVQKYHVVEGIVTFNQNGDPLENASVVLTGDASGEYITGLDGQYGFNVFDGTYSLTVEYPGYHFTPPAYDVTIPHASGDYQLDFAGAIDTYTVSGYVTHESSNEPYTNAEITATGSPDDPLQPESITASTFTNESGYYELSLPLGTYTIRPYVFEQAFTPEEQTVTVTTAGDRLDFVGTDAKYTFQITTRNQDLTPVPNVEVHVSGSSPRGSSLDALRYSDESGNILISDLDYGTYTYSVPDDPRFYTYTPDSGSFDLNEVQPDEHIFIDIEQQYDLYGTLLDNHGTPIPAVEVVFSGGVGDPHSDWVNQSGEFFFWMPYGPHQIDFALQDMVADPAAGSIVDIQESGDFPIVAYDLQMMSGTIQAKVLGSEPYQIGWTQVEISGDLNPDHEDVYTEYNQQSAGFRDTFQFDVVDGNYRVTGTKSEYTFPPVPVSIVDADVSDVVLTGHRKTYSVAGRFLDIENNPIAGVEITVVPISRPTLPVPLPDEYTAVSNSSGDFEIADLINGQYLVSYQREDVVFQTGEQSVTVNETTGNVTLPDIQAIMLLDVQGHITDSIGNPLSGITIEASGDLTDPWDVHTTFTNESGQYALRVERYGTYQIYPLSDHFTFEPDHLDYWKTTNLKTNVYSADFDARVVTNTIHGSIHRTDGTPLTGFTLTVDGEITHPDIAEELWLPNTPTTDESGRFAIEFPNGVYLIDVLPDSRYSLLPETPYTVETHLTDPTVNFVARAQNHIMGRLFDSEFNVGVANYPVHVSGDYTETIYTDESGYYDFDLDNGTYTIYPDMADYGWSPASYNVTVFEEDVELGTNSAVPTYWHQTVEVLAENTLNPLEGMDVTLTPESGNQPLYGPIQGSTDTQGLFETDVPFGTYTLAVSDPSGVWDIAPNPITVFVSGTDQVHQLSAAKPWEVTGILADESGNGLPNRTLLLTGNRTDLGGDYYVSEEIHTNAAGEYTFEIPSGAYRLAPQPDNYYDVSGQYVDFTVVSAAVDNGTLHLPLLLYTLEIEWRANNQRLPDVTAELIDAGDPLRPTPYAIPENPQSSPEGLVTWQVPRSQYDLNVSTIHTGGVMETSGILPDEFEESGGLVEHLIYNFDLQLEVYGQIATESGNALQNVPVILSSGDYTEQVWTNISGWYLFENIQPGTYLLDPQLPTPDQELSHEETDTGWIKVYKTLHDYNDIPENISVGLDWNNTRQDFIADQDTYSVQGTITDIYGSPVHNVTVTLDGFVTQTDDSGNYKISGIPSGEYQVAFSRPTFDFTPPDQAIAIESTMQAVYDGTSITYSRIDASVTDVNSVATGLLSITGSLAISDAGDITTHPIHVSGATDHTIFPNESGNFAVAVGSGDYTITPNHKEYTYAPASINASLISQSIDLTEQFIGTRKEYTVVGQMVDENNQPITGWEILIDGRDTETDEELNFSIYTDESGYYSFTMASGYAEIRPVKEVTDYLYILSPTSRHITVNAEDLFATEYDQNFIGDHSYRIAGYITDPSGQPVKNIKVRLSGTEYKTTYTDNTGYYSFIVQRTGTYTVAPDDGDLTTYFEPYNSREITTSELWDLTRHQYGRISGVVFEDRDDSQTYNGVEDPLANVTVDLWDTDANILYKTTQTDTQGYYEFKKIEVHRNLEVRASDLPLYQSTTPNTVAVSLNEGEHYTVNFGDKPQPTSIEGTVYNDHNVNGMFDWDEHGFPHHHISLLKYNKAEDTYEPDQETWTDASGNYSFSDVDGYWEYAVVADHKEYYALSDPLVQHVSTEPGVIPTINFGMYRLFEVEGTLSDDQGNPLPDVALTVTGLDLVVTDNAGDDLTIYTNSQGYYNFFSVSGDYTLTPELTEYTFQPDTVSFTLDADKQFHFEAAEDTYMCSGHVEDMDGIPVDNVQVYVDDMPVATTNEQGNYVLYLPLGTYTITCSDIPNRMSPTSREIEVTGVPVSNIDFYITRTMKISGRLTGTDGQGLAVRVQLEGTEYQDMYADDGGYFRTYAPEGTYTLTPESGNFDWYPTTRNLSLTDTDIGQQDFLGVQTTGAVDTTPNITGKITERDVGVSRIVRLYSRTTKELVAETMSAGTGNFSIELPENYAEEWGNYYFIIVLDAADVEPILNAQIRDRIFVTQLS